MMAFEVNTNENADVTFFGDGWVDLYLLKVDHHRAEPRTNGIMKPQLSRKCLIRMMHDVHARHVLIVVIRWLYAVVSYGY